MLMFASEWWLYAPLIISDDGYFRSKPSMPFFRGHFMGPKYTSSNISLAIPTVLCVCVFLFHFASYASGSRFFAHQFSSFSFFSFPFGNCCAGTSRPGGTEPPSCCATRAPTTPLLTCGAWAAFSRSYLEGSLFFRGRTPCTSFRYPFFPRVVYGSWLPAGWVRSHGSGLV